MKRAQSTPWGISQRIDRVGLGIAFVSTARHGGYRVSKALAEKRIDHALIEKWAIRLGNYYYFEEDCAWSVVAMAMPEFFNKDVMPYAVKAFDYWIMGKREESAS